MSKPQSRMFRVPEEGEEESDPRGARLSRSERTRRATDVNKLGEKLTSLKPADLNQLDLPEELREAIEICRGLKKQARARQKRLVGKILRGEDHASIRERVEAWELKRKSGAG